MIEASATRQWPWQAEPHKLWSLGDMIVQFLAKNFYAVTHNLEIATTNLDLLPGDPGTHAEAYRSLADVYNEAMDLPISAVLRKQIWRVMSSPEGVDGRTLRAQIGEVQQNLAEELMEHLFLCVPAENRELFVWPLKWFGREIATAFPEAQRDIRDTARCLALDEWTASVFHAMRVVQHGLHKLAERLEVTFTRDIEVLNWADILNQIEKRTKELAQQPKTPDRDAELQFASAAASHFFAIKEAWRNYVMHGRSSYDETDAREIVLSVRAIMRALA